MDYILQLRQYIGHRPILIVGAGILIVDAQNRLLLIKRSDNSCWGSPVVLSSRAKQSKMPPNAKSLKTSVRRSNLSSNNSNELPSDLTPET
jgi:hypothetical protein